MTQVSQKMSVPGRPNDYADLLAQPISDNGSSPSYAGWEQDHGSARSFYVGGIRTFLLNSGIDDYRRLVPFGAKAVKEVKDQTNWTAMPCAGRHWDECGQPQFGYARDARPTFFQKSALVIVACELALRERIANKQPIRTKNLQPEDIYSFMRIIPACWSVEEFDAEMFRELNRSFPSADAEIKERASQKARTFLKHLATGYTTTFATADATRGYIAEKAPKLKVGRLSASPNQPLGIFGATTFETVSSN